MRVRIAAVAALMSAMAAHAQTTTPVAGPTVKLKWSAPTANTAGAALTGATTYNLYQGACNSNATFAKIQSGIAGTSAVVSTGVTPGGTYGFRVTAVNAGAESAQSATVCASVAVSTPVVVPPSAPTGLTVLPS